MGRVRMVILQIKGNVALQEILNGTFKKVVHIQKLEVIGVGTDWRTPFKE